METSQEIRVWHDWLVVDQVSQFEARVHSKCVLCADFGPRQKHKYDCICAEWGRSLNGQPQLRRANRGVKNLTELMLNNMSTARGQIDRHTSPNKLNREARYLPNRDGKVKISFAHKHEAAEGAGEEKEYTQIWERNVSVARSFLGKGTA